MNAAFYVLFSVFVLAMLVVAVLAVRWGVQRDRAERAARTQRNQDAESRPEVTR